MTLRPQDIFILLKMTALGSEEWTYASLAYDLGLSASEIHQGVKRSVAARLMDLSRKRPIIAALEEFLLHGIRYAFPPDRGGPTRGIPTSYAASPLREIIVQPEGPPPVWPDPEGETQGFEFSPLYRTVPMAAKTDPTLYELLALVDGIRGGNARERDIAGREISQRLRK